MLKQLRWKLLFHPKRERMQDVNFLVFAAAVNSRIRVMNLRLNTSSSRLWKFLISLAVFPILKLKQSFHRRTFSIIATKWNFLLAIGDRKSTRLNSSHG